jgi:hypothetical protein
VDGKKKKGGGGEGGVENGKAVPGIMLRRGNVRGLKDTKSKGGNSGRMEKARVGIVQGWAKCNTRGYIAIGLAETWRTGVEELTEHGCMLLSVGLKKQQCNRGSVGVATLLNEEGVVAFKKGGMVKYTGFESARVMWQ